MPPRVLFLCTHNSARSQLAEGLLRQMAGGEVEVASAGTEPSRVHPMAERVLRERGIDPSRQRSKHVDELRGERFDWVITVCDAAREACPIFPGALRQLHWSLADPSAVGGEEEARQRAFVAAAEELERRLRDVLPRLLSSEARGLP